MNEPAIEEHGVVKFLGEGAGKVDALGAVDLAIRQRLRRRPEVSWVKVPGARCFDGDDFFLRSVRIAELYFFVGASDCIPNRGGV
jgi:hypothetical protein